MRVFHQGPSSIERLLNKTVCSITGQPLLRKTTLKV